MIEEQKEKLKREKEGKPKGIPVKFSKSKKLIKKNTKKLLYKKRVKKDKNDKKSINLTKVPKRQFKKNLQNMKKIRQVKSQDNFP